MTPKILNSLVKISLKLDNLPPSGRFCSSTAVRTWSPACLPRQSKVCSLISCYIVPCIFKSNWIRLQVKLGTGEREKVMNS